MTVELRRVVSTPQIVIGIPGNPLNVVTERNSTALFNGSVSVGATSTTVRLANAERNVLRLVNDSNSEIYINLSATAVLNAGIRLNRRGGSVTITEYTGAVTAISGVAGSVLTITEVNKLPTPP